MLIERSTIDDNIRIRIKFLFFSPFKILRDYRKSHEIREKKNPRNCFANQKARPLTWDRFFTREKEKKKRKMLVFRPEVNYYGFKVSPMANLARNSAEFHFFFIRSNASGQLNYDFATERERERSWDKSTPEQRAFNFERGGRKERSDHL